MRNSGRSTWWPSTHAGVKADALRAFQRTRHLLDEDLGIVPSPRLRRLEEQILLQDPDIDAPPDPTTPGRANDRWIENPYLGLRAFREADHARFFGQEQLVERLLARVLDSTNFTAVVGPSGSGKSSAVQAGLIPRIRQDHPDIAVAADAAGRPPLQCPRCCACGDQHDRDSVVRHHPRGTQRTGRMHVRDASGRARQAPDRRRSVRGTLHDGRRRRGRVASSTPCRASRPPVHRSTSW